MGNEQDPLTPTKLRGAIEQYFATTPAKKVVERAEQLKPPLEIPKNKDYPADAVQCHDCGGWGCPTCDDKGWLPHGHPKGRKCYKDGCENPIPPAQVAVYCSNECASADA